LAAGGELAPYRSRDGPIIGQPLVLKKGYTHGAIDEKPSLKRRSFNVLSSGEGVLGDLAEHDLPFTIALHGPQGPLKLGHAGNIIGHSLGRGIEDLLLYHLTVQRGHDRAPVRQYHHLLYLKEFY
jgi:hypothetical protein